MNRKKHIAQLEAYLRLEKSRHYDPCSEQHPGQASLFNEAEQIADEAEQPKLPEKLAKKKQSRS